MTDQRFSTEIDTSLLKGFTYACRPDCGLCCYAEPLVSPEEKPGLVRILPQSEFVARGSFEFLPSYPAGGACKLLRGHRCGAHSARPAPCREFPLTGYVGIRPQVSVVLTCPGVDLSNLDGYPRSSRETFAGGLEPELAGLRARAGRTLSRQLEESRRRRNRIARTLAAEGCWVDEEEVRQQLRGQSISPRADDFPAEDPPAKADGLELLPLMFGGRDGPVAFSRRREGWELLELRPTGGVHESLGVAPPPDHPPVLSEGARRLLQGYVRYWLERDQLFGSVHLDMIENRAESVTDAIASELRRISATVVSRAYVLASVLQGNVGPLSVNDVGQGIRATDQDLLDRPAWGTRL